MLDASCSPPRLPSPQSYSGTLVPGGFSDRRFQNTWIFKLLSKGFFFFFSDGMNYFHDSGLKVQHRNVV